MPRRCKSLGRKRLGESRTLNRHEKGYCNAWAKAAKQYRMANPLCVKCGGVAEQVDHIIPFRGDERLKWDIGNWQSLCRKCHAIKTASER